jgi:hypothetical protein
MQFERPHVLQNLLHETVIEVARLNPEYPCMFTLDNEIPDSTIQMITYNRFVSDVFQVANELQKSIRKRQPGTVAQNVGILARSTYSYAVHWMACQFNSWIVSFERRILLSSYELSHSPSWFLPGTVEQPFSTFSPFLNRLICSLIRTLSAILSLWHYPYPSCVSKIFPICGPITDRSGLRNCLILRRSSKETFLHSTFTPQDPQDIQSW